MKEHAEMVQALAKPGSEIASTLSSQNAHIMHMVLGICGEAGEIVDAVKKVIIYRKEIDLENLIEELGDLEFYLEGLRQGLGITRELVLDQNIQKLSKRYNGFKYSDQAAQIRADKS